MRHSDAIVIGAGQAGLAMSHCLGRLGVAHVVLERSRVAERWRSERWDSLRLLTPNWMSRLPGWSYAGDDPHGYMTMPEVAAYLEDYARSFAAPVETGTAVGSVDRIPGGYRVATSRGAFAAPVVVVATGQCDRPCVPAMAAGLPADIVQVTPPRYRNPRSLPEGGVLVVGASASGIQLADEIHASGRPVTLAVGRHTRLPRVHRGRDIMWWLERIGALDRPADSSAMRRQPSLQLVGRPERAVLDLGVLRDRGVRVVGRACGIDGGTVRLAGDLAESTAAAEAKLARLMARIDAWADAAGMPGDDRPSRPLAFGPGPTALDLGAEGIRTVVWATGYARDWSWLRVPVLDRSGEVVHRGGITPSPGLYVLGLEFLRRRNSNFIDGVGVDAEALARHIHGLLAWRAAA